MCIIPLKFWKVFMTIWQNLGFGKPYPLLSMALICWCVVYKGSARHAISNPASVFAACFFSCSSSTLITHSSCLTQRFPPYLKENGLWSNACVTDVLVSRALHIFAFAHLINSAKIPTKNMPLPSAGTPAALYVDFIYHYQKNSKFTQNSK